MIIFREKRYSDICGWERNWTSGILYICTRHIPNYRHCIPASRNSGRYLFHVGHQSLLYSFIDKHHDSPLKQISGFVRELMKDLEAVDNAVSSQLSNGFVEGTNSKLKMVKRTMYGRCSRQLLAAKLLLEVG